MESPLSLSVVVITVEGPERLRTCLEALEHQSVPPAEILVPWDGSHGATSALDLPPRVRILPCEGGKRTFAELRAFGIRAASADIVAITEDHFTPATDWCEQIIAAHASSTAAAIGGAVDKQAPDSAMNWAFYLADYLRYLDPTEGPAAHLTDGNVTYKRTVIEAIRHVWSDEFHENVVHAELQSRGETLWISPRILVRQKRSMSVAGAVRDRYAFGRLFGSTRVESAPTAVRVKLTVASLLLPPFLVAGIAKHVLRTRRYAGAFLRSLPAILLISTVWAWGEFVGYLTARPEASLSAKRS